MRATGLFELQLWSLTWESDSGLERNILVYHKCIIDSVQLFKSTMYMAIDTPWFLQGVGDFQGKIHVVNGSHSFGVASFVVGGVWRCSGESDAQAHIAAWDNAPSKTDMK